MPVGIQIARIQLSNSRAEFSLRQQLPELAAVHAAFSANEQQHRPFALQFARRADRRERAFRDAEQLRTAAQGIVIGCHAQRIGAFTVRLHARHPDHALRRSRCRRAGLAQGSYIDRRNRRLLRLRELRDPAVGNAVGAIDHIVVQRLTPERRNIFPDNFVVAGHFKNAPVRSFVNQGIAVFQALHVADVRTVKAVRIGRLR